MFQYLQKILIDAIKDTFIIFWIMLSVYAAINPNTSFRAFINFYEKNSRLALQLIIGFGVVFIILAFTLK